MKDIKLTNKELRLVMAKLYPIKYDSFFDELEFVTNDEALRLHKKFKDNLGSNSL